MMSDQGKSIDLPTFLIALKSDKDLNHVDLVSYDRQTCEILLSEWSQLSNMRRVHLLLFIAEHQPLSDLFLDDKGTVEQCRLLHALQKYPLSIEFLFGVMQQKMLSY